jgi:hypothetical protein
MTVGVLVASAALTTAPPIRHPPRRSIAAAAVSAPAGASLTRSLGRLPEFSDPRPSSILTRSRRCLARRSRTARRVPGPSLVARNRRRIASTFRRAPRRRVESLRDVGVKALSIERIGTIQSPGVVGVIRSRPRCGLLEGTSVSFRMTGPDAAVLELAGQGDRRRRPRAGRSHLVAEMRSPARDPQTIEVIPRKVIERGRHDLE